MRLSGISAPGLTEPALERLRLAYAQLGIQIDTEMSPLKRALASSSSGKTDGEVFRIGTIGADYSSLVRVNVPVGHMTTYAYTNRPELFDAEREELKKLRVGYVIGAIFAAEAANDYDESWALTDLEQLFHMLQGGRIELILAAEAPAEKMINKLGLVGKVRAIPSTRDELPLYHYLHERHANLVPRVEAALRDVMSLKNEGETN
jgi:ABC-type amino acid transport substrate-binding protein